MKRFYIIPFLISAISMAACTHDECAPSGSFSVKAELTQAATKAGASEAQLLEGARLDLYYADFSGLIRSYRYSELPEVIWLPAGSYRVDVIAGEAAKDAPVKASWDSKSYAGSAEFSVEAGRNSEVEVEAGVSNAITKITFGSGIAENFAPGYTLTIGVDGNNLSYNAAKSGAEGYFIIDGMEDPEFEWTFSGSLNGASFTRSGKVGGIAAGKMYTMTLKYTQTDGDLSFDLQVDESLDIKEDIIVFEPVSTGLAESAVYEIWAAHATVHADVDESEYSNPSAIKFAYRTSGGSWTEVAAERVSPGSYKAVLTGLTPATDYSYKLVIGGSDIGDAKTFTTEQAPSIPNGSFEQTSKSASGNYTEFYSSYEDAWWGSGNGSKGVNGSADFGGFIICAPDKSEKQDGAQSACLTSTWALVKFAAGNLFSGYFAGLVGTKGGKVAFGRAFTGRPTALKVWVKYSTGKINRIDSAPAGVNITTGDYDTGRIQIALGNWDYRVYGGTRECPILVNTTDTGTFVDFATDGSTIAYGDLQLKGNASNSHNVWKEYTIPIEYDSEMDYPSYIVISCASSMYGDYFTGCDSSKMWVDKMELVYE